MARRRASAALLAVACAALTGCSASSAGRPVASAAPVPRFPEATGARISTESPVRGDWVVRLRVRDADAAYAEARRLLVDAGYTLTKDRDGRGGGDGQACTPRQCVGFGASDVPPAGSVLVYEVFHSTGVVG